MITTTPPNPNNEYRMYAGDLLFWKHNGKEYCLRVDTDDCAQSPRDPDFCTNVSIMACFHPRHNLGDDTSFKTPGKFWAHIVEQHVPGYVLAQRLRNGEIPGYTYTGEDEPVTDDDYLDDFLCKIEDEDNVAFAIYAVAGYVAYLPLWLYEHSGITMSCGARTYPYNDRWDSGQVGWIVIPKYQVEKNLRFIRKDADGKPVMKKDANGNPTREYETEPITDENWEAAALDCLQADVKVYDQYLTGDVYWFRLMSRDANTVDADGVSDEDTWEEEDSCGGFYGADIFENGMLDHIGHGITEALESHQYTTGTAKSYTTVHWNYIKAQAKTEIMENPKLGLSQKATADIVDTARRTLSALSFFTQVLTDGNGSPDDVNTYMSLLRHGYDDLSVLLAYGDTLNKEITQLHRDLREANGRIRAIQAEKADAVSADTLEAWLNCIEQTFETWYQLAGFRYCSVERQTSHGLIVDLSDELEVFNSGDDAERACITIGDPALAAQIVSLVPFAFKTGWDLQEHGPRTHILDTDNNKRQLETLLSSVFPASIIHSYTSHHEQNVYYLRANAYIPYADILAWRKHVINLAKNRNIPGGKLYAMRNRYRAQEQSRTFARYSSAEQRKQNTENLARVSHIIDMWEDYSKAPKTDGILVSAWNGIAAGTAHTEIVAWFEQEFNIDVKTDLEGNI